MAAAPVFVDVDTGVDDAIAVIYLLASPDARLVGIASTGGNVGVDQVCRNNLGLLDLCRVDGVPVSRGAEQPLNSTPRVDSPVHGPQGLGYAELPPSDRQLSGDDAATAWIAAAHQHQGELIGVATGPLTNLALALRLEPELPNLLRRLVIMGGAYDHIGNTSPVAEWNVAFDPEAAAEVFAAWSKSESAISHSLPILCGLDVTRQIALTPEILNRLAVKADSTTTALSAEDERGTRSSASNPLIRVIEDATRFYLESYNDLGHGYLAHLHDPLAAAVALEPQLVQTRETTVDVELTGTLTRGMTVTDWSGRWARKPNALVAVAADPAKFFDRFIDRVGPFAAQLGS